MKLESLKDELEKNSSKKTKQNYKRFFSESYTSKDEIFLGVSLPIQRKLAKKYESLPLSDIKKLLTSKIHEHKMIAGIILSNKFQKNYSEEVLNFYLNNSKRFDNWDLVDTTASNILGKFLLDKKQKRKILYELTKSKNLWERRISIVSTHSFIKQKDFGDTLKISEILFADKHHLIHKAMGWMLREIGKRNKEVLIDFLKINYSRVPRVTLRYSIERFPEKERKKILKGDFI